MNINIPLETVKIDLPVGSVPQRRFRYEWTLELTTDRFAEQIVLDPEDSQLLAKFLPYSFDIKSADFMSSTIEEEDRKTVIVALDQPLRIKSIHVDDDTTGSVELYRMDGSAIAPEPTVTRSINNGKANTISDEFTATKFAIRLSGNQDLKPGDIQQLHVQSYPTAASIGFLDTRQQPASIIPLLQADSGLVGFFAGNSTPLTEPIQRYLNSLEFPLQTPLTLTMVAASDAPCRLRHQLSLGYSLKRETFLTTSESTTPAPAKQSLRFTSATLTPQTINIGLPPNSHPRMATIRFADSTQPADPLISANRLVVSPASTPSLSQNTGIQTHGSHWIGQRFTPEESQRIDGLLLGLLPLQPDTQLSLSLQTDANGLPSGETITRTTINLKSVGKQRWYAVSLDPVTLDVRPYWWLLSASQGSVIWITEPNTTASVEKGVYLFSQTASTQVFETLQHYPEQTAMVQVQKVTFGENTEESESEEARANESAIAFRLNNIELPAVRKDNIITVNLLSALSPVPDSARLSVAVSQPSILTAYPPVLEYDL